MSFRRGVEAKVFRAIQNVDMSLLSDCNEQEIRPVLPCLVRMGLISPLDTSKKCTNMKVDILTIVSGMELVNSIVALLSIDFHRLESEVKKEQQLRQKGATLQSDSILIGNLTNTSMALEYERSDMTRRLSILLGELLFVQSQIGCESGGVGGAGSAQDSVETQNYIRQSELFDNDIFAEELSDIICIALAELPVTLNIIQIVETLLHLHNGPAIICRIVANFPDCFREVSTYLIQTGEKQEETKMSTVRASTITLLCKMNPTQALSIRSKCVELCRMPALAIALSLDHSTEGDSDMVAFISGLLLGNDQTIRNWIALFIRTGQKKKGEISSQALQHLRDSLLNRLNSILAASTETQLQDSLVVQASAILRLYCALRGIAAIKFQDDEVTSIVKLLTSHPSPTPAGVRFVSIGLCMLIACPSLISANELERKSIEWVQWLVKEEAYFESASGVSASFGEMLLLMAIHFHSNQLSAICDLVCATLGMKIPIRHNNMTRMKQVFTQEIFTEQVVTAHAVKVPVTNYLNANMAGFLPIHCIHQLLKSRAFAKHNVSIKNWIYKQICTSISPLHPVLPMLVEVYVTSVIMPTSKNNETNKPLTENEIRKVFQSSVHFGQYFDKKQSVFNLDFELTNDIYDITIDRNSLTPQLLLLYYLLLYEDCRLSNAHILASYSRKIKIYSPEFMSELPIKYLLHHAQKDQSSYSGLFGPLLKLLATHFPHLTLVEDWLDDMSIKSESRPISINEMIIVEAFNELDTNPAKLAKLLQILLKKDAIDIWPYAETFTQFARNILANNVPRYIQDLYKDCWLRLNTVLPRRLWALTVKNLVDDFSGFSRIDVAEDPLQIMRCDERVFRCAPIYAIVLRVLRASLASSRSQLMQHLQANPRLDHNGQVLNEGDREEMCRATIAAQFSLKIMEKRGHKRRRHSPDERPHTSKRPQSKRADDYILELRRFLQEQANITNPSDFWKFHDKYRAIQQSKPSKNRHKLLVTNFSTDFETLYDRLPTLDRSGEKVRLSRDEFQEFLTTIRVYQDFQLKTKFNRLKKLRESQKQLPIYNHKAEILARLEEDRVLLIAGDTGCGKSTQVPQYILEAGHKKIVCTQPRRIACISLAKRVGYELLSDYKSTVGYQIRFEKQKRADTNIIFLTEGLLLRQAAEEETLTTYDVIILDEVHERHLHGDFLVAIMKCWLYKRANFKLVLMSATINLELFINYFKNEKVSVIKVPGRLYPIEINYRPVIKDAYDRSRKGASNKLDTAPYLQIVQMIDERFPPNQKGDLLIFLNGYSEINQLADTITEYSQIKKNWIVIQLHSTLSIEEQDKVFDYPPEGVRKCIISTNIAETSVTIDGVRFVIDSGKVNRMIYSGGINKLTETNISQDSAKQRAGRAGRTGPGICYRLYSEQDFNDFDPFTPAEIHLVPLESLILQMINLGLTDIKNFPFLETPGTKALEEGIEKLKYASVLDLKRDCLALTPLGGALSQLPVDLTVGKMLVLSVVFGNVNAILVLASLLSVQSPLTQTAHRNCTAEELRRSLDSNHGDPLSLLNYYKEWLSVKQDSVPVTGRHHGDNKVENSRMWSRKRCLEEQRFYEVTKLTEQFREILVEAGLLEKMDATAMSSGERAIRHGELKQLKSLRYNLKNEKKAHARKQLKLQIGDEYEQDGGGAVTDLRDIEFRITNDYKKLRQLLNESSTDSFKDLMMLKLILTSGFYPQIAVEDEFNGSKTVADRLYHTKQKNYVFLRPMSAFQLNPEILQLHDDDIEVPPSGYFSKRPISRKHQLLVYQSILETKKVYLMNTFRMPAVQTLLLFGKSIVSNRCFTKLVIDEFLLVDLPFYGQGKNLLMRALKLRKSWKGKLGQKLENPQGRVDKEGIYNLMDDLVRFMQTEVSYNIKRLLPADLKDIYTRAPVVPIENCKNPFDPDFIMEPNNEYGGLIVTENLTYGALVQEQWADDLEYEIIQTPFECHICQKRIVIGSCLEIIEHEFSCCQLERSTSSSQSVTAAVVTAAPLKARNSKSFICDKCGQELFLSPVEILKHKKSCK